MSDRALVPPVAAPSVLFVHHGGVRGGAPLSLLETILGLQQLGFEHLAVLCVNEEMEAYFRDGAGVPSARRDAPLRTIGLVAIGYVTWLSPRTLAKVAFEMLRLPWSVGRQAWQLWRLKPSVVHLNSSILIDTAVAARIAGIPVVWHVRETILGGDRNPRRRLYARAIRSLARQVIAIGPDEARRVRGSAGEREARRVSVVHNFVDIEEFRAKGAAGHDLRARLGIAPHEFVLLTVGGTAFRKGTFEILESLAHLRASVHLIVAGPGAPARPGSPYVTLALAVEDLLVRQRIARAYKWHYAARIAAALDRTRGGASRVSLVGYRDDVAALIGACDALVFGGTTPHFPRPVYEAWVLRKPVVAFDSESVAAHVTHRENGIVVARPFAQRLAEAVDELVASPTLCSALAERGAERAETLFDRGKNVRRIAAIYARLGVETPTSAPSGATVRTRESGQPQTGVFTARLDGGN